jgi:hypothetical protein
MEVNDPNDQRYRYNYYGTNQPLLGNIGRALDHQASLGLTTLDRWVFDYLQSRFVLEFLKDNHPQIYNRVMMGPYGIVPL